MFSLKQGLLTCVCMCMWCVQMFVYINHYARAVPTSLTCSPPGLLVCVYVYVVCTNVCIHEVLCKVRTNFFDLLFPKAACMCVYVQRTNVVIHICTSHHAKAVPTSLTCSPPGLLVCVCMCMRCVQMFVYT